MRRGGPRTLRMELDRNLAVASSTLVERSGKISLFARPWLSGPTPAYTDTS